MMQWENEQTCQSRQKEHGFKSTLRICWNDLLNSFMLIMHTIIFIVCSRETCACAIPQVLPRICLDFIANLHCNEYCVVFYGHTHNLILFWALWLSRTNSKCIIIKSMHKVNKSRISKQQLISYRLLHCWGIGMKLVKGF